MYLNMLKGKIHRATVTQAELDYVGSITVDVALLEAAGIREYELVQVVNINNGTNPPRVVFVDESNQITRMTRYEKHGLLKDMN